MKKAVVKFCQCIYDAALDVIKHDGIEHAGYLSFIIILSLFPFLVFFTALASVLANFLHQYIIDEKLLEVILNNTPSHIISGIIPRVKEIVSGPPQSLLTLAIVGTIWTSSSAVEAIRTILNKASRVYEPPPYILRRLLSIAQFLIITFVLIITITCITLMPIVFNILDIEWGYLKYTISEMLLLISIVWLYFMIPNTRQKLVDVMPGALIVTILWTLASIAFAKYLELFFNQLNIIYGGLAGIIVSLLFFYILSVLFIYGAELNYRIKEAYRLAKAKT